jgi:HKD family nuclease
VANKSFPKFDLREALNKRTYDHAVICSFTFDASFFEEYCLEKLTTLSNNGNITFFVDKGIYEEILLGPESQRPQKANLRYLLYPISVPGVFHPKLFLLAGRNKGKLIIGSANFTRAGITSNAEIVGYYEYEAEKNEQYKSLFQQAFDYLLELARIYKSENLDSNLQAVTRDAEWLLKGNEPEEKDNVLLLHNLEIPLWSQLIAGIEPPVDKVFILSRFFDNKPALLDKIETDLNPKKIYIYTQNGVTNLTPEWLEHPLVKSGKAEIFICSYTDNGYIQPLHAKAVAIQKDNTCLLAFGSANFSSPALLRTARSGNAEIMVKLPEIATEEFRPEEFFDPDNTALRLIDGSILQTSKNNEEEIVEERVYHEIRLLEVTFNDKKTGEIISIKAEIPIAHRFGEVKCKLTFNNQVTRYLKINHEDENLYFASVPVDIKRRLNEESTIIQIEAFLQDNLTAQSNKLLVTNLKDIKTDKPVRRERHIKEAQQSAVQFFAVLRELIGANDDEAILTFLNHCDIPLSDFARPSFLREARPVWDGGEGMRKLGDKNLKIYTELHPAAMAFFDKHFRKLQRHVERLDINGIENFLHIFLAMGGILRSQVERAVIGLESKKSSVTPEEWGSCRNYIDIYFGKFKQLMECLWRQYLSQMVKEYKNSDISERFLPDLQPINDLCADMLSYRERVENLRVTKLKRTNEIGRVVTPAYFHCVFSSDKWEKYSSEINTTFKRVEETVRLVA